MMTFIEEPPAPAAKLAEVKKDSPAMMLGDAMMGKLEEAQNHILNELDQLISQIEQIKSEIRSRTLLVQQCVREHFELSAEAMAFKHKVETRLRELQNGTQSASPPPAAAAVRRAGIDPTGSQDAGMDA